MSDSAARVDEVALTFEVRLMEIFADRRERSRAFSSPYIRLWESLERMAAGGKKIRPGLLMDAYEALGGTDERVAVEAACAMEILHIALVIHDDVIDKDLMRRGEANISGRFAYEARLRGANRHEANAWGEASSILAGDLMLTLAHSLLARLEIPETRRRAVLGLYDDTVFETAAGEHYDVWLSMHLEQATPSDVLTMIGQKTAAYSFQAPLVLAAVLAGSPTSLVEELAVISRQMGVIYQLRDDVLGLFGDERETGKSTLGDLREGKETLLIAYARSDPSWRQVEPLFGDSALTIADAHRLRRVIEESGARLFVESLIDERRRHVDELVRRAGLPPGLRDRLTALSSACSSRVA